MKIKNTRTLTSFVVNELSNGKRLNQKDFLQHGSWRLASIIHSIEHYLGIKISRAPLPGRAVEYYLEKEELKRLHRQDKEINRPTKH